MAYAGDRPAIPPLIHLANAVARSTSETALPAEVLPASADRSAAELLIEHFRTGLEAA